MNATLLLLLGLLIGLGLGVVLGWLLKESKARLEIAAAALGLEQAQSEARRAGDEAIHARNDALRVASEAAEAREGQAQLAESLTAQFRNLATEILEERTKSFSQTSSEKLGGLLSPLQDQLDRFRKRIDEVHESHTNSTSGLQERGELILERTLELSGLERGREFELQVSTENRLRPDAVINLPEGRFIVVDSKVSLVDYERSCNAEGEEERAAALTAHAAAVRQHIKSLSEKGYPDLFEGRTPEVVMMFMPIEPAFGAALTADKNLFEFAFSHRVILVTPSTLLAALRTVTNVWKVEKQTKNVLEIARLGGVLHDKLTEFAKGLLVVKQRLTQATEAHDDSIARLKDQKGNILGTATRLHELGAKAEKQMPKELMADLVDLSDSQVPEAHQIA
ncbi:MAG: DNA recombination protein RmuC [Verrucomicrobia bacterium]|nr:DNA recombination protein RmuC [Verrucomicrobiota bacterium]